MDTTQIIQNGEDYLLGNVRRQKSVLMRGEGPWVFDSERGKYLDFFAGIAVNALGQAAPEIVDAVTHQVKKIGHVSNWYYTRAPRPMRPPSSSSVSTSAGKGRTGTRSSRSTGPSTAAPMGPSRPRGTSITTRGSTPWCWVSISRTSTTWRA